MQRAAKMFDRGYAFAEIAAALTVTDFTVRLWLKTLRPGCVEKASVRHWRAAQAAGFGTVQAAVVGLAEAGATYLEIEARLGMCGSTVAMYLRRAAAERPLRRKPRRGLRREWVNG